MNVRIPHILIGCKLLLAGDAHKSISTLLMQLLSDELRITHILIGCKLLLAEDTYTFIATLRGPADSMCSVLYGAACLIWPESASIAAHNCCTHQGCQQRTRPRLCGLAACVLPSSTDHDGGGLTPGTGKCYTSPSSLWIHLP